MFDIVELDGKKYGLLTVLYKNNKIPVIFDVQDMYMIKKLGRKWTCNINGSITINIKSNNKPVEIKLHELIMLYDPKTFDADLSNGLPKLFDDDKKNVLHINRLGLDNRRENLIFDTINKNVTKNLKKKKRTVVLPKNSGIKSNELPTYVWYAKPDSTHGERFVVRVGDIIWKSSSSDKISLRYKLEEAKAYLRNLKLSQPRLFHNYSMNGDYNATGRALLESYYKIIYKAGFNHIKNLSDVCYSDTYLAPTDLLNPIEKKILSFNTEKNSNATKQILRTIPNTKTILPEYCYYRPKTDLRGDYFMVKNHPKHEKTWVSSTSKFTPTKEKYKQMLSFMKSLQ